MKLGFVPEPDTRTRVHERYPGLNMVIAYYKQNGGLRLPQKMKDENQESTTTLYFGGNLVVNLHIL